MKKTLKTELKNIADERNSVIGWCNYIIKECKEKASYGEYVKTVHVPRKYEGFIEQIIENLTNEYVDLHVEWVDFREVLIISWDE